MLDRAQTIKAYLTRLGQQVTLIRNGEETTVFAVIEQTWKRNKSRFEKNASPIGRYYNRYYIYYGPADYDIRTLSEEDCVLIDGETYYFVQADCVRVGETVQYYRGVLKHDKGGSYGTENGNGTGV